MATVYAHTNDGYVSRFNESSWSDARATTTGNASSSTTTGHAYAASAYRPATRGGGTAFSIYRSFFFFDVSDINIGVESATFKVYGFSQDGGDLVAVKSNSDIETLGTADFGSIVGWDTTTDGSTGGDNAGNVTFYSDQISTWSTSGYNDIALNSTALADMRNDGTIYICLLNYDYDLRDVAPTGSSTHRDGMYYTNYTGTSRDPYIDYTLDTTDGVFFGANF